MKSFIAVLFFAMSACIGVASQTPYMMNDAEREQIIIAHKIEYAMQEMQVDFQPKDEIGDLIRKVSK